MTNRLPIAPGLFTWPAIKPALLGSRCNDCGILSFPVAQSCPPRSAHPATAAITGLRVVLLRSQLRVMKSVL